MEKLEERERDCSRGYPTNNASVNLVMVNPPFLPPEDLGRYKGKKRERETTLLATVKTRLQVVKKAYPLPAILVG